MNGRRALIGVAAAIAALAFQPRAAMSQTVGDPAPDFSLPALDGKQQDLSKLKGQVVILDFWASWCGPCREELPFLATLYRDNPKRGLTVLAVNVDSESRAMQSFIQGLDFHIPFPVVPDPEGTIPSLYQIPGMPTVVFIDRKGTVRYVHSGFRSSFEMKYRTELAELLEESE